ncbi:MAG: hypothetical protein JRF08_07100 [Deltaproteobacteria bacterium]|nr:hypothetical protein [Deltaproteobacteria bacterium]
MEALNTFHKMMASMASQGGTLLSHNPKVQNLLHNPKVQNLFLKRAENAAYDYIIKENEHKRPMIVQKEIKRKRCRLCSIWQRQPSKE